jgi:hypothetical protein
LTHRILEAALALSKRPNGLEIAKHPVGEPPGQLFDSNSNTFCRSWAGSAPSSCQACGMLPPRPVHDYRVFKWNVCYTEYAVEVTDLSLC